MIDKVSLSTGSRLSDFLFEYELQFVTAFS